MNVLGGILITMLLFSLMTKEMFGYIVTGVLRVKRV